MFGLKTSRSRKTRRNAESAVTVPQLIGGINRVDPANMVADNELIDGNNVWDYEGMLVRRPAQKNAFGNLFNDIDCVDILQNEEYVVVFGTKNIGDQKGKKIVRVVRDGNVENFIPSATGYDYFPVVVFTSYGENYEYPLMYTKNGVVQYLRDGAKNINIYSPMLFVNGKGSESVSGNVSGDIAENFNLLSPSFRAQYTTDGKGVYFFSSSSNLSENIELSLQTDTGEITFLFQEAVGGGMYTSPAKDITMGGQQLNVGAAFFPQNGYFFFYTGAMTPVALPAIGVSSNITAKFTKSQFEHSIYKYKMSWWFGGDRSSSNAGTRLFLAGNEDDLSKLIWSDVNDPTYFPENSYARVKGNITNLSQLGANLVVFTADDIYSVQYVSRQVETAYEETAYFPISHISNGIGCSGSNARLVNNRIVWAELSKNKVYALYNYNNFSDKNVIELDVKVDASEFDANSAAVVGNHYVSGNAVMNCSSWNNVKTWLWSFPTVTGQLQAKDGYLYRACGGYVYKVNFANPYLEIGEDDNAGSVSEIKANLKSKFYDFSAPYLAKRIDKVFFTFLPKGIKNSSDPLGEISFVSADVPLKYDSYPQIVGSPLLNRAEGILRYFPNSKSHFFSIRIDLNCYAEIYGITIKYQYLGEAR